MKLWKFIVIIMIGCFLFYMGIAYVVTKVGGAVVKEVDNRQELIGQKVLINKDTLVILDYSISTNNYMLSNGTKVAVDLAKKNLIK